MKRLVIFLVGLLWTTVGLGSSAKIRISQVVDHPALNETTRGIIDVLREAGYADIRVESAQGNATLASQIASKCMAQDPAVMIGVGTLAAQSLVRVAKRSRIPVIFSSITDPIGAGLVTSLTQPSGTNVSGVSNFMTLEPQLTLFRRLQPNLKRLGILYNPGEMICIKIIEELEKLCPRFGITLVKQVLTKTADVTSQATKLAGQVDALFISNDNTALSCLPSILTIARARRLPVYVSDTDGVASGCLAALGPNQYEVGRQTGEMAVRVLNGTNVGTIPVSFPTRRGLFINEDVARDLTITIPHDIKKTAILIARGRP